MCPLNTKFESQSITFQNKDASHNTFCILEGINNVRVRVEVNNMICIQFKKINHAGSDYCSDYFRENE